MFVTGVGAIVFGFMAASVPRATQPGSQPENSSVTMIFVGVAGIVVGIQSFFFAFLVDVSTDIRWFLNKLVDKD